MPLKDPEARRAYHREYMKRWYIDNADKQKLAAKKSRARVVAENRERVDAIKSIHCTDCGGFFPPICIDFDHLGEDKTDNISTMVLRGCGWPKIAEEIAKCEIVCANCHRVRTAKRRWSNGGSAAS